MTFIREIADIYDEILNEDYQSSSAQALKILQGSGYGDGDLNKIQDAYNNVQIDDSNQRPNHKDMNIPILAFLYVGMGGNIDTVKNEYQSYINSPKATGQKLFPSFLQKVQDGIKSNQLFKPDKKDEKIKFITSLSNELVSNIHKYQAVSKDASPSRELDETDDVVYEDNNITVYRADSKAKCIYYGRNSNLCISTKSGENYYWRYRMGNMRNDGLGMTTYFVYWNNSNGKKRILIDALGDEDGAADGYSWNPISPNEDDDITKDKLISKYPELQPAFDEGVFQFLPYGEREKRFQYIDNNVDSVRELESLEDIEMYIESDNELNEDDWYYIDSKLPKDDVANLIMKYVGLGSSVEAGDLVRKYLSNQQLSRYTSFIVDAEDPKQAYQYADNIADFQNVPDEIVEIIAWSPKWSYEYAMNITASISNPQPVPEKIVDSIIGAAQYSYNYARFILRWENVPDEMMNSIMRIPQFAYFYAKDALKGQNVPYAVIKSVAREAEFAYEYVKNVLKGQNIPDEIIRGIASDPRIAYDYADDILQWQNVPDSIMGSIASDPRIAYKYANDILQWKNVPDSIMDVIINDPVGASDYVKHVLKYQNIPPKILKAIALSLNTSYRYIEELPKDQQAPDDILDTVFARGYYADLAYSYAKERNFKDIPPVVLTNIVNSAYRYNHVEYIKKILPYEYYKTMASIDPSKISSIVIEFFFEEMLKPSERAAYAYRYATTVLLPNGITFDDIFNRVNDSMYPFFSVARAIQNSPEYSREVIKKYYNNKDYPYALRLMGGDLKLKESVGVSMDILENNNRVLRVDFEYLLERINILH
jgi:hypothetical protein